MTKHKKKNHILSITASEKYRTIDDLFEGSKESSTYYTLLMVSVLIVTAGLILGNSSVVIGGMLVAPVLTPILVIALGLEVGRYDVIHHPLILVGKSVVLSIGASLFLAWIFGAENHQFLDENTMKTAFLYFLVAICAGVAGTFAWARKEVSDVLPGIAISVALVPPLAQIGIWFSLLNLEAARFYVITFLLNLLGITIGSWLVFSFLKFYRAEHIIRREVAEVHREKKQEEKERNAHKK